MPAILYHIWYIVLGSWKRQVKFHADTKATLRGLPKRVRSIIGADLTAIAEGIHVPREKPLKGFGGTSVRELVVNENTDTYRVVIYLKVADKLYVVDAFQKKSHKGGALPKEVSARIRARIKEINKG